jgi:CheY-like chemotaxis protein
MILPQAETGRSFSEAKEEAGPEETGKLQGKVLIAEDNEINLEIAVRLLKRFGLSVDTAVDGRQALEKFSTSREGEYAAVLLDIQMPYLNGYETAGSMRALKRDDAAEIPIIAMTADAFSDDVEKSRAAGMNAHIAKPVSPDDLYRKLKTCLRIRKAGTNLP